MAERLLTERLVLRQWTADDAGPALSAYGDAEVARWLAPAMDRVGDEAAMRLVLQQWMAEDERMLTPAGRWAIELRQDRSLIGMEWVGETEKYHNLRLQEYRLRPADLAASAQ